MVELQKSGAPLKTPKDLSTVQQEAISFQYEFDYGLTIAPTGTGKTVITLTAIAELLGAKEFSRVLVIAPAKVVGHWHLEASRWSHLQHLNIAAGTGAQRLTEMINSNASILVTSFDSLATALSMEHGCTAIVFDEITRLRKVGGETYRKLWRKIRQFTWRHGLSASPLAEDWQGLYGMIKVLDLGERLGTLKHQFMSEYFIQVDFKGYKFEPRENTPARLTDKIKDIIHIIPESEKRKNLHEPVINTVPVVLPDSILELSHELATQQMLSMDQVVTAQSAGIQVNKLRQLTQGFIYTDDKDPVIFWDGRIKQCVNLAKKAGKCIIIYEYTIIGDLLKAELPGADRISGKMKERQFNNIMDKWRKGKGQHLLLQFRAGAHGLDGLQFSANNIIFYAPIWSNDATEQVIGRLDRTGQEEQVKVQVMLSRTSIDEDVLTRIYDKKEVFTTFLEQLNS